MDEYILFEWATDEEGGYGVCSADKWNPKGKNIYIGCFNNVDELAALLYEDNPEFMVSPLVATVFALDLLTSYLEMEVNDDA